MTFPQLDAQGLARQWFEHRRTAIAAARKRMAGASRIFLGRMNMLSADGPVSGKSDTFLLIVIPALTFGAVALSTSIAGVAYRPGCNSASNFLADLVFRPKSPSTCESVPFLSDIPTVILSFTSPFALVAYRLLRRRLSSLVDGLLSTGLLRPSDLTEELSGAFERLKDAVDLTALRRVILFVASIIMTTWLYSRDLTHGHLFAILAKAGPNGTSNAAALRASWWANYHHHLFLAVLCVSIGSTGVYYALRAGWLYVWLGAALITSRKTAAATLPLDYVPTWRDKSYGWSPITAVLILIYFSTVSFAISMVAVFDMLQSETWTLYVAIFVAAIGVISDVAIILSSFIKILIAHKTVEERLRESLIEAMRPDGGNNMNPGEYAVAAADLSSWRPIPVSSFSGSALKILPGLYGFIQFARAFFAVKH